MVNYLIACAKIKKMKLKMQMWETAKSKNGRFLSVP
jgi:hypothetical protein